MIATVGDSARLDALCEKLAHVERIAEMLQAKRLARLPIDDAVALLLEGG